MMAKAPIAFLAVFVFSVTVAWLLTWKVVVPAMQVQIDTKQGIIDRKQSDVDSLKGQLDSANRENDKLRNENAAYEAAHADKSSPLKDRAIILAKQLSDFGDLVKTNENDNTGPGYQKRELYREMWSVRFEPRVSEILKELDVLGQSSDYLPAGISDSFNIPTSDQTKMIASEINRMATNLPELESP
jgi:hypothetical protein